MTNLAKRFVTGFIGVPLVLGAILFSEYTFLLLMFAIAILALLEFYHLCSHDGIQPQKYLGLFITFLIFVPPILNSALGITWNPMSLLILMPFIVFIRELYTKSEKPYSNIAYTILGVIYLAVPLFLFYLISSLGENKEHYNPGNIIGYMIILWCYDTGAYFAGTYFGKHKLFERLSPKKTWEGVGGGIVLAAVATFIIAHFYTNFSLQVWMIIAALIALTGTLGDLVGSLFKRSIHIKDSGSLLPGHGGILDRFDALFLSAPFVFVYLAFFM